MKGAVGRLDGRIPRLCGQNFGAHGGALLYARLTTFWKVTRVLP